MKVFISWSGEKSRKVAELFKVWLKCVVQAVEPWVSSEDLDRGSIWFTEINKQLNDTSHGIVCLTKSNQNKPWILFESGALAKGLSNNRVFVFLIDLVPNDVKDPLYQFNLTESNQVSVRKLLSSINNALGEKALSTEILTKVFNTHWPDFEAALTQILVEHPETEEQAVTPKNDNELLNEILSEVRGLNKRVRNLENNSGRTNDLTILNSPDYYMTVGSKNGPSVRLDMEKVIRLLLPIVEGQELVTHSDIQEIFEKEGILLSDMEVQKLVKRLPNIMSSKIAPF